MNKRTIQKSRGFSPTIRCKRNHTGDVQYWMFRICFPLFKWRPRRWLKHQPVIQTDSLHIRWKFVLRCFSAFWVKEGKKSSRRVRLLRSQFSPLACELSILCRQPSARLCRADTYKKAAGCRWVRSNFVALFKTLLLFEQPVTTHHRSASRTSMPVFLSPYGKNIHPVVCLCVFLSTPRYKKYWTFNQLKLVYELVGP
jgi:hypothetical protein